MEVYLDDEKSHVNLCPHNGIQCGLKDHCAIYRGVKQMIIGRLHREASAFTVHHYFFLPITQQSLRWQYRATLLLQHGRNRLTIDLIGNLYCFLYCFYFTMYLRLRNDAEHRAAPPPPPRRCCQKYSYTITYHGP